MTFSPNGGAPLVENVVVMSAKSGPDDFVLADGSVPEKPIHAYPEWVKEPFRIGTKFIYEAVELAEIFMQGIGMVQSYPALLEALQPFEIPENDMAALRSKQKREIATSRADRAKSEIERGFPLLKAHTLVAIWAAMESTVRNLLVAWIANKNGALDNPAIQSFKLPLAEFQRLDDEDRIRFMVNELERATGALYSSGVARFEGVLSPFGLGGPVERELRRDVFELNHVRNNVVHSAMRVDRKLVESCPWLELQLHDPLEISDGSFYSYTRASTAYILLVLDRARAEFGLPSMREYRRPNGGESSSSPPDS